jgi:hypothetical protein
VVRPPVGAGRPCPVRSASSDRQAAGLGLDPGRSAVGDRRHVILGLSGRRHPGPGCSGGQ